MASSEKKLLKAHKQISSIGMSNIRLSTSAYEPSFHRILQLVAVPIKPPPITATSTERGMLVDKETEGAVLCQYEIELDLMRSCFQKS